MKKSLLIIIMVLSIFLITGCGKKENKNNEPKNTLAEDEVVLENIKYKSDQDDSEYGIDYKIASNFRKTVLVNAVNYYSEKINDVSYFVIRIFHYNKKSIDYAIKDTTDNNRFENDTYINLQYTSGNAFFLLKKLIDTSQ